MSRGATYTGDVRKEDIDAFAMRRPVEPFEMRLVDGQRFRLTKLDQFIAGKTTIAALTRKGAFRLISRELISTIRPAKTDGRSATG